MDTVKSYQTVIPERDIGLVFLPEFDVAGMK